MPAKPQAVTRMVPLSGTKHPFCAVHIYVSDSADYKTPFHMTIDMDKHTSAIRLTGEEVEALRDALTQVLDDRRAILLDAKIAEAEDYADKHPETRESPWSI